MSAKFDTPQEDFWAGEFGDSYITRNESEYLLAANIALFAKIFSSLERIPTSFLDYLFIHAFPHNISLPIPTAYLLPIMIIFVIDLVYTGTQI
jgi:spore coat polysaccharide biosynthesis protein SpsF